MKLFKGGIPTDADVKKIRDAFPDDTLKARGVIPYYKIEELIQCDRKSQRFVSVTNRWRKLVEHETRQIICCKQGEGFEVASESKKVSLSTQKQRSGMKNFRRSMNINVLVKVSDLTEQEEAVFRISQARNAAIISVSQTKGNFQLPESF